MAFNPFGVKNASDLCFPFLNPVDIDLEDDNLETIDYDFENDEVPLDDECSYVCVSGNVEVVIIVPCEDLDENPTDICEVE